MKSIPRRALLAPTLCKGIDLPSPSLHPRDAPACLVGGVAGKDEASYSRRALALS